MSAQVLLGILYVTLGLLIAFGRKLYETDPEPPPMGQCTPSRNNCVTASAQTFTHRKAWDKYGTDPIPVDIPKKVER